MELGEQGYLSISSVGSPSTCLAGFSHGQGLRKEKEGPEVIYFPLFRTPPASNTHINGIKRERKQEARKKTDGFLE